MDLIDVLALLLRQLHIELGRLASAEGLADEREVFAQRVDQNLLDQMQVRVVQLRAVDEIAHQALRLRPDILPLNPFPRFHFSRHAELSADLEKRHSGHAFVVFLDEGREIAFVVLSDLFLFVLHDILAMQRLQIVRGLFERMAMPLAHEIIVVQNRSDALHHASQRLRQLRLTIHL